MRWLNRLFNKPLAEKRLDQELQFHVEEQTAAYVAEGVPLEEARRRSQLEFGGIERVKEEVRDTRWESHFETVCYDCRYAWRVLRKDIRFSLTAILTLALGIGAVTAMFSVVYNLWFDPFPYKDADRLMLISIHDVKDDGNSDHDRQSFSASEFRDLLKQNQVFEDMVGSYSQVVSFADAYGTRRFGAAYVTANTFEFFGVAPLIGRGLTQEDAEPGAPPVFVMNYKAWKGEFDADATMVGKTYFVDGKQRTLVGVMPPRFQAYSGRLWLPIESNSMTGGGENPPPLWTLGRRKVGISAEGAASNIEVIAVALSKRYPSEYPERFTVQVERLGDTVWKGFRVMVYAFLVAVAMLLFIACGNVANLLLVKATTREREVAVRISLGASPVRLIRQLFVESFVLAAAGGLGGCALAYLALRMIAASIPYGTLPDEMVIGLSPTVLVFAVGLTLAVTVICGVAPALHALRSNLHAALAGSSQQPEGDLRHGRLRSALVIAEVAVSVILLVGTGLLTRSFVALTRIDLGFNPRSVFVGMLATPKDRPETVEEEKRFFRELLPRVRALPGVTSVTVAYSLPPIWGKASDVVVPGKNHPEHWYTRLELCSEEYFETLGLHLQRGRVLSASDVGFARRVTVVNETLARQFFGSEEAIGRAIRFKRFDETPNAPHNAYFEIIGVVSDISNSGIRYAPIPAAYLPYTIAPFDDRIILARTERESESLLASVRREVWAVDSRVAVTDGGSLQSLMEEDSYTEPRFDMVTSGTFAAIGLVLVILGVFSVMAYTVSLRTHEMGIRVALGAARGEIVKLVLRKGAELIALGVGIGLAASLALTRFIASQIWSVSLRDPWTFATVVGLVAVAGLSACLLPAMRAARVDPMVALRYE